MRFVALLTAAALAALILAAPAAANPWLERRPLNIAHQGGEIEAPSDTLYAFERARRLGADVLEMDLHMTKDGHVVVMHDETVDRTTNGTGSVEDLTLAEVKKLDAAYWFVPDVGTTHSAAPDEYVFRGVATGQRRPPKGYRANDFTIPTLDEVLRAFPRALINLELKPTTRMTGRLEPEVARLLRGFGRTDDVIVVSFLDHSLELFKAIAPEVHTATATGQAGLFWASSQGPAPGLPNPRHVALQVPIEFNGIHVLHDSFIDDAHANDLAVHVWTINDEATMRSLLAAGADGIMTDRPTLLERLLRERPDKG
jgi:glycerophosphoryl diester phosphodiesterase